MGRFHGHVVVGGKRLPFTAWMGPEGTPGRLAVVVGKFNYNSASNAAVVEGVTGSEAQIRQLVRGQLAAAAKEEGYTSLQLIYQRAGSTAKKDVAGVTRGTRVITFDITGDEPKVIEFVHHKKP
jgi:hypothetical protein